MPRPTCAAGVSGVEPHLLQCRAGCRQAWTRIGTRQRQPLTMNSTGGVLQYQSIGHCCETQPDRRAEDRGLAVANGRRGGGKWKNLPHIIICRALEPLPVATRVPRFVRKKNRFPTWRTVGPNVGLALSRHISFSSRRDHRSANISAWHGSRTYSVRPRDATQLPAFP